MSAACLTAIPHRPASAELRDAGSARPEKGPGPAPLPATDSVSRARAEPVLVLLSHPIPPPRLCRPRRLERVTTGLRTPAYARTAQDRERRRREQPVEVCGRLLGILVGDAPLASKVKAAGVLLGVSAATLEPAVVRRLVARLRCLAFVLSLDGHPAPAALDLLDETRAELLRGGATAQSR